MAVLDCSSDQAGARQPRLAAPSCDSWPCWWVFFCSAACTNHAARRLLPRAAMLIAVLHKLAVAVVGVGGGQHEGAPSPRADLCLLMRVMHVKVWLEWHGRLKHRQSERGWQRDTDRESDSKRMRVPQGQ